MVENADDIDMKDLDRDWETQQANEKEEETGFTDDSPGEESILTFDGSNPNFSS